MRITVKAHDRLLIDQSAERIVETAENHGAEVVKDIPIIDILNPTSEAVDALLNLELPDGVDIEVKP